MFAYLQLTDTNTRRIPICSIFLAFDILQGDALLIIVDRSESDALLMIDALLMRLRDALLLCEGK